MDDLPPQTAEEALLEDQVDEVMTEIERGATRSRTKELVQRLVALLPRPKDRVALFRGALGKVTDERVAELAGVCLGTVRNCRRAYDIPGIGAEGSDRLARSRGSEP